MGDRDTLVYYEELRVGRVQYARAKGRSGTVARRMGLREEGGVAGVVLIAIAILFVFIVLMIPLFSIVTDTLGRKLKFCLGTVSADCILSTLGIALVTAIFTMIVGAFFKV